MRSVVLLLTVAALAACSRHTATGPSATPPSSPSLTRLSLCCTPLGGLLGGQRTQITAKAIYSDESSKDVTSAGTSWRSSNQAIATISSSGMITALASGTFEVSASYGGLEASLRLTIFYSPFQPPAADEVTGYVREITGVGPIDLWPAEVEVIGGAANGRVAQTNTGGIFRIDGLPAAGFDLIARKRGYAPARVRVDSLGRELDISLGPAPGMISDILEGAVCLPTRTISRTFRPLAPGFLRVTALRDGSVLLSLYANGVAVKPYFSTGEDIELNAGVSYDLRATGSCDSDTGPARPTVRISLLRPSD